MKFTIAKDRLSESVTKAERVSGKNLSLPVLRCALLSAADNKVVLRATNLDLGLEVTLPAAVAEPGTAAIPADVLHSFLSAATAAGQVSVETQGNNAVVSSAKSTTKIATYPADDFPTLPKVEAKNLFTITAKELAQGLRSVWWAASASSIKPELGSVYLYPEGETLVLVATDSFRLAEKKVRAKKVSEFDSLLLPLKNIAEIIRQCDGYAGDITLAGDAHQIAFQAEETYLTSRIIDGVFPDYKQIMPGGEPETSFTALKQDVLDALKHARIFSDQFNKLTISVTPKEKQVTFATSNTEVGEAVVSIDAAVSGEALDMHFNYQYILDSFQALGGDSVAFAFSGSGKPVLIRPVGDASFRYIVMPMNR